MQHQPGKIEHCLCLYSSYTQNCAQITVLDLNKFEIWVHRSLRKELNEHLRCLYWSLASEAFLIEWEDYLVAQSFRDVTENINDNHLFYFIFFWFINSIWDFFPHWMPFLHLTCTLHQLRTYNLVLKQMVEDGLMCTGVFLCGHNDLNLGMGLGLGLWRANSFSNVPDI